MATTEKIVQQILADAKERAAAIVAEGEKLAEALLDEAKIGIAAGEEARLVRIAAQGDDEHRRTLIAAELAVRREILAKKQELIRSVYDLVLEKLVALSDDLWESLIVKLVLDNAESGRETIRFNRSDAHRGKAIIPKLNAALTFQGQEGKLLFDETPGEFRGGFILVSDITEINVTFEAMVRILRIESEAGVATLLFADET